MPEHKSGRLERLWEYGYRVELAQTFWPVIRPWVLPAMTGLMAAFLRASEHAPLSQVFLIGLIAFVVPLVGVMSVKSYTAISRGKTILEDLKIVGLAQTETIAAYLTEVKTARPPLSPTVDMLEEGRKAQLTKRESLIATWRAMVADAHQVMIRDREAILCGNLEERAAKTATAILEADTRFLSLRPWLTPQTKLGLWPTIDTIMLRVPEGFEGSTMDRSLRDALDDIDALARQWGID